MTISLGELFIFLSSFCSYQTAASGRNNAEYSGSVADKLHLAKKVCIVDFIDCTGGIKNSYAGESILKCVKK